MLDTSARLLRLLAALQARRFWSGPDLADRFEVTPRTLRRDIDRLRSLGYAVEATSGPGGGYQLGNGASVPPLLLDDDEAVAVTVALRSAADSFDGVRDIALQALVKLDQLLPERLRRRVGALHDMTVSVTGTAPRLDLRILTSIAAACRDDATLELRYRARDGAPSQRRVEPLRLAHTPSRRWYLVAWDLDRCDWRTFRVDRIEEIVATGPRFVPRPPPGDLADYVADSIARAPFRYQARIRLFASAASLAGRIPPWCGQLEPGDDDRCTLVAAADSVEAVACQIIFCGTEFEILEPRAIVPELRAIVDRLARATAAPP